MHSTIRGLSLVVLCAFVLSFIPPLAHAEGGSIVVEQNSTLDIIGSWTLLYPNTSTQSLERSSKTATVEALPAGRYTIIIRPPEGMSTSLELLRGNEVAAEADHPQVSFDLGEGDALRLSIEYSVPEGGIVSVSSHPPLVKFELTGPSGFVRKGVTPQSFEDFPLGNYSVKYLPEGCPTPPAQSVRMAKEKRADFSITLKCDSLVQERDNNETLGNAAQTTFVDVPEDAWFAPYVATVNRRGILTGYRDAEGNPTGEFGPGNAVTIAELSKIAHEMGIVNEKNAAPGARNEAARGTWFEQYFASAEQHGWLVFQNPELDPSRPATKGEVISTFLQTVDVPMRWPKGKTFSDVSPMTPHAGEIETAFSIGLVEGSEENGSLAFHPTAPINRAEISKILIAIQEKYQQKYQSSSSSRR